MEQGQYKTLRNTDQDQGQHFLPTVLKVPAKKGKRMMFFPACQLLF